MLSVICGKLACGLLAARTDQLHWLRSCLPCECNVHIGQGWVVDQRWYLRVPLSLLMSIRTLKEVSADT